MTLKTQRAKERLEAIQKRYDIAWTEMYNAEIDVRQALVSLFEALKNREKVGGAYAKAAKALNNRGGKFFKGPEGSSIEKSVLSVSAVSGRGAEIFRGE